MDALKKRQLQEERLKRERIRKRMRSDCTMDDILGEEVAGFGAHDGMTRIYKTCGSQVVVRFGLFQGAPQ